MENITDSMNTTCRRDFNSRDYRIDKMSTRDKLETNCRAATLRLRTRIVLVQLMPRDVELKWASPCTVKQESSRCKVSPPRPKLFVPFASMLLLETRG